MVLIIVYVTGFWKTLCMGHFVKAVSDEDKEEEEEQEEDCDEFLLVFSPIVTHTVIFKCMGTTKEDRYQERCSTEEYWSSRSQRTL